jgi:hypothetical protein
MKDCWAQALRWFLIPFLALTGFAVSSCGPESAEPTGPVAGASLTSGAQAPGLTKALAAEMRYTDRLLQLKGVVGTAVGLGSNGQAVVQLYTTTPGVPALPSSLDGVPVSVVVTGEIRAMPAPANVAQPLSGVAVGPTSAFNRPVPIGVSTGNQGECSSGTIGARVKSGNTTYALSNNHVYALENTAPLGSNVLQPGRADLSCFSGSNALLGSLTKFVVIQFSASANNRVDAAIAAVTTGNLGKSTPTDGYGTPSSTIVDAVLNQMVQKYGRTTGLTTGTVVGVNTIMNVGYSSGTARFVGQITIKSNGQFSRAGDSGALIVDGTKHPVGLLFAGSLNGYTYANQIGDVLRALQVSIDGN